jgi:DNA-binding XRE family transcriptional regulator
MWDGKQGRVMTDIEKREPHIIRRAGEEIEPQTIRAWRRELLLTQAQLGKAADLSIATIFNIEAGKGEPTFYSRTRLIAAFERFGIPQWAIVWDKPTDRATYRARRSRRKRPSN